MLFKDVVGNEVLKAKLKHEIESGKIAHARLLSGTEGDGKLSVAFAYIQYLMCENRQEDDSCGTCKACVKNQKLIHPDVHFSFPVVPKKSGDKPKSNDYLNEWRKAVLANPHVNVTDWLNGINAENKQGNITSEECRDIIKKLSLKPFESDTRVLMMWLPEYLGNAGNTLLKILEEPPPKTYFILITEKVDKLLATIVSRVQISRVQTYTEAEIQSLLEAKEVDPVMAKSIAYMSDGNMHMANTLLHDSESTFDPTSHFQQWMRHCFQYKMSEMMAWSDDTAKMGRENIKAFLIYALTLVRECMAAKMIPDYGIRYSEKEQEFIRNFSRALQFANIETLYVEMNKTIGEIERNANPKITLFNLSVQLAAEFLAQRRQKV